MRVGAASSTGLFQPKSNLLVEFCKRPEGGHCQTCQGDLCWYCVDVRFALNAGAGLLKPKGDLLVEIREATDNSTHQTCSFCRRTSPCQRLRQPPQAQGQSS